MHLIQETIDNFIANLGLPDWSTLIIYPLLGGLAIALVVFIVTFIFWGILASRSRNFLKNGVKATARYVDGGFEYAKTRRDDPEYKEKKYYYVTYEFQTAAGETISKRETITNSRLAENYRTEPAFEIYYMPNNPKSNKKVSDMSDIQSFKNVPKNTGKTFAISAVVILVVMIIGLFTDA